MKMPRKIILITGASGGLGQVLCRTFSSGGVCIGIHVYRNRSIGERLVQNLNKAGGEGALFSADLRDSKSVRQMFNAALAKWGRIDLLINNAGKTDDHLFAQMTEAAWDEVIDTNLSGAFYCMREAGRVMHQHGGGHIINISSHVGYTGRVGQASYASSKRGLIALTQSAAKEWGKASIQVNAVLPGFLPTKITAVLKPLQRKKIIEKNALQRPSTLKEVSDFILHLSHMKHVSGQVFNLDSRID